MISPYITIHVTVLDGTRTTWPKYSLRAADVDRWMDHKVTLNDGTEIACKEKHEDIEKLVLDKLEEEAQGLGASEE